MFAVGIGWSLFTLFGIGLLLPRVDRRLWAWQVKRKGPNANLVEPSRPQRVVFILLASLMTAVAFAAAFHRDLAAVTSISSSAACSLMMLLPALYFALGMFNRRSKKRPPPEA